MGDASIRIMAIFGADDADDAKTMVSMPAWMDEQDDSERTEPGLEC